MVIKRTYRLSPEERRALSRERIISKVILCLRLQGQAGTSRCHNTDCGANSGDSWLCILCTINGCTGGVSDTVQSYQRQEAPIQELQGNP